MAEVEELGQFDAPFGAVVGAVVLGPEIMGGCRHSKVTEITGHGHHIGQGNRTVAQPVGGNCVEPVGHAVELVQGSKRRLERVGAVAGQDLVTQPHGQIFEADAGADLIIGQAIVARIIRVVGLIGEFRFVEGCQVAVEPEGVGAIQAKSRGVAGKRGGVVIQLDQVVIEGDPAPAEPLMGGVEDMSVGIEVAQPGVVAEHPIDVADIGVSKIQAR